VENNRIHLPTESKECVLVIDDDPRVLSLICEIMEDIPIPYKSAESAATARKILESTTIDLVISDIRMPDETGVDLLRWCRKVKYNVPFILVSGQADTELIAEALNLGAKSFLRKPFSIDSLKKEVNSALAALRYDTLHTQFVNHLKETNKILEERVAERTNELQRTQDVTILSLAALAEIRDPETGGHIERTRSYVKCLAQTLAKSDALSRHFTEENIELLYRSAPLHDIGKVGIPDSILLKPGKLTSQEFEVIKKHTIFGGDTLHWAKKQLGSSSFLSLGCEIAYQHHEKWDGTGYPYGLSGENISVFARLMALADVYDALISKRCYKSSISYQIAHSIILKNSGTHFDPSVVEAFENKENEFRRIAKKYSHGESLRNIPIRLNKYSNN
jgi:putative two-component system response regulator